MSSKTNLIVDIIALVIYLVVATPALTGVALHEWLSLSVGIVFIVHVAFHADWIVDTLKIGFKNPSLIRTGNLILNILITLAFLVCFVSGLLISGDVLAALHLYAPGYYFWDPLHSISAKVLLALLVIHVVVHGKWILSFFKKGKGDKS